MDLTRDEAGAIFTVLFFAVMLAAICFCWWLMPKGNFNDFTNDKNNYDGKKKQN